MEDTRFWQFTLMVDGIHKCIQKIKSEKCPQLGLKSVHVFWIYALSCSSSSEGLTAAELARISMIDRSLVSREIAQLLKQKLIFTDDLTKRKYNAKYSLTAEGQKLAKEISGIAFTVQKNADRGISGDELESFYVTLGRLYSNFQMITNRTEEY